MNKVTIRIKQVQEVQCNIKKQLINGNFYYEAEIADDDTIILASGTLPDVLEMIKEEKIISTIFEYGNGYLSERIMETLKDNQYVYSVFGDNRTAIV